MVKIKQLKILYQNLKKYIGDKYDYSKIEYKGNKTKVCIICKEHGEFWITPSNILNGRGCKHCKFDKLRTYFSSSKDEFITKAIEVHSGKYDYSKVEYVNSQTKVCIICPKHGEFWQTPNIHLRGGGCKKCSTIKVHDLQKSTTEQYIERAREVHGNKYDYSKIEYKGNKTKVCIICPIHGEFWQNASSHLQGRGCSLCNKSHLEKYVKNILEENNINYIQEKSFSWLDKKRLDFYLPEYNIAIECQGKQHFKKMIFFDKGDPFHNRIKRDKMKKQLCNEHGIRILYFTFEDYDEFLGEKLIKDKDKLLNEIYHI